MKQNNTGWNFLGKHPGGKLGNVGRATFKWISGYISPEVEISHL
jgi:hypothetical protein